VNKLGKDSFLNNGLFKQRRIAGQEKRDMMLKRRNE
jgi:hypothetical protein